MEKEAKTRRITSLEEENAKLRALLEAKEDELLSKLDFDMASDCQDEKEEDETNVVADSGAVLLGDGSDDAAKK